MMQWTAISLYPGRQTHSCYASRIIVYLLLRPFNQNQSTFSKLLRDFEMRARMTLHVRPTTRMPLSRLITVSIYQCTFVALLLPQVAVLARPGATEAERPCQKNDERSENEQVVSASIHRRLKDRRHCNFIRQHGIGGKFAQVAWYDGRLPSIVGHQLSNGLRAPLLI